MKLYKMINVNVMDIIASMAFGVLLGMMISTFAVQSVCRLAG